MTKISGSKSVSNQENIVIVANKKTDLKKFGFSKEELVFIKESTGKKEHKSVMINQYKRVVYLELIDEDKTDVLSAEAARTGASAGSGTKSN